MEGNDWLNRFFEQTYAWGAPHTFYWWGGTIGVIIVLIILWRIKHQRRNFKVLRDEGGTVETTHGALRDLVHLSCENVETASAPKIRFRKKGRRVNVLIRAKLYEGQRLADVRDALRRHVTKTFKDTHGIEVGEVDFVATGFKKSASVRVEEPVESVDWSKGRGEDSEYEDAKKLEVVSDDDDDDFNMTSSLDDESKKKS
ncbi:MAG: hypothetical protein ACQKBV_10490 [Puniceicoccales bacterium]